MIQEGGISGLPTDILDISYQTGTPGDVTLRRIMYILINLKH